MNVQSIEIMGPEYVLMLGVWWGAAVFLTVVFLAAKRAFINWRRLRDSGHTTAPAASSHVDA